MPPATRHLARATKLVKLYIQHQQFYKTHREALLKCRGQSSSHQQLAGSDSDADLHSGLSSSFGGSDITSGSSQDAQSVDANSDGTDDWLSNSDLSLIPDLSNAKDFDMPFSHWQEEDSNSGWDTDGMSGGSDGDDEESTDGEEDKDDDDILEHPRSHFQSFMHGELEGMYTK
jgi:hypothetical protein